MSIHDTFEWVIDVKTRLLFPYWQTSVIDHKASTQRGRPLSIFTAGGDYAFGIKAKGGDAKQVINISGP
jgi:hypothetical protein